jgi:MacB-like periplasmic core domain
MPYLSGIGLDARVVLFACVISLHFVVISQVRLADNSDRLASRPLVTIINETFAKLYFPSENPLGSRIDFGDGKSQLEVVGVVDDIKEGPLDIATRPAMYMPFSHMRASRAILTVETFTHLVWPGHLGA